jgi:protein-S-isoprenylcysteine O-methyltransferase Ste14
LFELNAKRETIRGQIRENLTLRLFMLVGTATFAASLVEYVYRNVGGPNWPLFALGWICAISSFWIRSKAISALGRFWSLHVEIRENHEFVRSGPFRFVRHPAYFSMVLELAALALICGALWTLAVVPLVFIPALYLRIRIEEAALIEKFGPDYVEYRRHTPALIPAFWRIGSPTHS